MTAVDESFEMDKRPVGALSDMENNMELWDIYNADREKTGRTMQRGTKFQEGDYHLVIHVCIFDSDGRMLIQQRQKDKRGWPNLWDITVGGSALAGENAQTAAMRELYEELGIRAELEGVRPHLTVHFKHGFDDIFLVEKDVELSETVLQAEEVQAVRWATRDEIKEMIVDGSFIPYYAAIVDLLFDMRKKYDIHEK